jgi:RNA polymerase sigma-70 factor, ECF subfamily
VTDRRAAGHAGNVAASATAIDPPELDFAELYAAHHDGVRRTLVCLGVPEAIADDALQEVFVVVHERLDDPTQYQSIKGWIYGIARRVAWRHHRTDARAKKKLALVDPPRDDGTPESELARREAIDFMHEFLDGLDADQREVFVLAEIEGLSAPEIATIVSAKLNTVYSRLRLARGRFEQALQRRGARARREEVRRGQ